MASICQLCKFLSFIRTIDGYHLSYNHFLLSMIVTLKKKQQIVVHALHSWDYKEERRLDDYTLGRPIPLICPIIDRSDSNSIRRINIHSKNYRLPLIRIRRDVWVGHVCWWMPLLDSSGIIAQHTSLADCHSNRTHMHEPSTYTTNQPHTNTHINTRTRARAHTERYWREYSHWSHPSADETHYICFAHWKTALVLNTTESNFRVWTIKT